GELINEMKIDRPSIILETMHEKIQAALKQDITENNDGMDIAICRFKFVEDGENRKWELKYAGAKQPAYLKRKNSEETEIIEANRRGIGGQSYADIFFFEDKDCTLDIGDRIYLTSDGIKDQNNVMRKRFGTNRLKMMFSLTSTEKIQDQKIAVETLINNWQGLEEQRDDISLWGIELGDHALVPQM
ncbi:MAG: SpoIIE family protein phosphatase, partial [Bacteroidales bacterium]|nr:SpoIIE family protein phosphatase [Bacteroidales bacterium]